jgi:hydroxyacylglutathione hydrolase
MFVHRVKTEGLAHLSYVIGDGGQAAVIDPRRDCRIYQEIAYKQGAQITCIFETHRNEDFVIGSVELAQRTGATIFHGQELPFAYGQVVQEDDTFDLGKIRLKILKTPGHTEESISIVLADTAFSQKALAVFTGDALFIGDTGRTDFFPGREEEMARLLYDSIFKKILPLGDEVIIYPAHGAGSVCGAKIAQRDFSTLGYERRFNPVLQYNKKEDFIRYKVNEYHSKPPYFTQMEEYNLNGAPALGDLNLPKPVNASQFEQSIEQGLIPVDIRSPEAFAGAYIPGSLAIPLDMVPAYAGWFLPYDQDIGLIVDDFDHLDPAIRHFARIGYDRIVCYLEKGLHEWSTSGRRYDRIPAMYPGDIQKRISENQDFTLLDVRSKAEFSQGHLPKATHIFLGDLPNNLEQIPESRPITTFCGSGKRAIIAASLLKQAGFDQVEDALGSMQACAQGICDIVSG